MESTTGRPLHLRLTTNVNQPVPLAFWPTTETQTHEKQHIRLDPNAGPRNVNSMKNDVQKMARLRKMFENLKILNLTKANDNHSNSSLMFKRK